MAKTKQGLIKLVSSPKVKMIRVGDERLDKLKSLAADRQLSIVGYLDFILATAYPDFTQGDRHTRLKAIAESKQVEMTKIIDDIIWAY